MRVLTGRTGRGNVRLDMTTRTCLAFALLTGWVVAGASGQAPALSPDTRAFVKLDAPLVALVHAVLQKIVELWARQLRHVGPRPGDDAVL